jgi:predicted small lipoprotein YifL
VRRAALLLLLGLAACGPLELAGDAAVGTVQAAAGVADLAL